MSQDLVSNMLTRIRNANLARKKCIGVPFSKLNMAILAAIETEGYILSARLRFLTPVKTDIIVCLKYAGLVIKTPVFLQIKQISKPGRQIFSPYTDFNSSTGILKYAHGVLIVSTPFGVMSHKKAYKFKQGGEILCYIG